MNRYYSESINTQIYCKMHTFNPVKLVSCTYGMGPGMREISPSFYICHFYILKYF